MQTTDVTETITYAEWFLLLHDLRTGAFYPLPEDETTYPDETKRRLAQLVVDLNVFYAAKMIDPHTRVKYVNMVEICRADGRNLYFRPADW